MCSLIIWLLLMIILCGVYLILGLILGDILFGIFFLAAIGQYAEAKNKRPSVMQCRNCGSSHIRINSQTQGVSGNLITTKGGWLNTRSGQATIQSRRIKVCQDCGFYEEYLMPEDVVGAKNTAVGKMIIYGILFAACAYGTFVMLR